MALFQNDIVVKRSAAPWPLSWVAEVVQVHGDSRPSHEVELALQTGEPILHQAVTPQQYQRMLEKAEPPKATVLVSNLANDELELLPEIVLEAVQRDHPVGATVKRSVTDTLSGVVINTQTTCTLQPLSQYALKDGKCLRFSSLQSSVSPFEIPSPLLDVPAAELKHASDINEGTLIVYRNWVGTIRKMSNVVVLRLENDTVVELHEDFVGWENRPAGLSTEVGDIVSTTKGHLRTGKWIVGAYNPNVQPIGIILKKRIVAADIQWLHCHSNSAGTAAPPSSLEHDDLQSASFQIYPQYGDSTGMPQNKRISRLEPLFLLHGKVRFRDNDQAERKYDGSRPLRKFRRHSGQHTLSYDMNVLSIIDLRTQVSVLWQDSTMSVHDSVELIEDLEMDETHSVWPGEIAHTVEKAQVIGMPGVTAPRQIGVVQSINPTQRTAVLRWCPDACVQFSDVLTQGGHKYQELIRNQIGIASNELSTVSLYDIETAGQSNVARGDLVLILDPTACGMQSVSGINWFGTIVEDCLDGTLRIRLALAQPVQDVILLRDQIRVAVRFGDYGDTTVSQDADSDAMDTFSEEGNYSDEDLAQIDGHPLGHQMDYDTQRDYFAQSITFAGHDREITYQDENGQLMDAGDANDNMWESESEDDVEQQIIMDPLGLERSNAISTSTIEVVMETQPTRLSFTLHDSDLPQDHHYAEAVISTSSARMRRIQKEHRIFQKPGAIPTGVHVHSWEARPDLWRVLLIGPKDTPYEDAPFVVDICLPVDFPHNPPQAYFHSWRGESGLGAAGPVNPNLYEDGTICLSLLGTWSGRQRENWNAAESTLLQVVVSILGLVLVKEPYFNEAGYDEYIGTEAAKGPSILYSERVVLRSLNFAISAVAALRSGTLLPGMSALEQDLDWLYLDKDGLGLLSTLQKRVSAILRRSEQQQAIDGLHVLSLGACISLKRARIRLDQLLAA